MKAKKETVSFRKYMEDLENGVYHQHEIRIKGIDYNNQLPTNCGNCKELVDRNFKFCPYCGAEFDGEVKK